jgi:hypothetical protein
LCLQPSGNPDCPCVTVVSRLLSHVNRTSRFDAPGAQPLLSHGHALRRAGMLPL